MEKLIDMRVITTNLGIKNLVVHLSGGGASMSFEDDDEVVDVVRKLHDLAEMVERGALGRMIRRKAPWLDFAGNEIHEGDVIQHPDGMTGTVAFQASEKEAGDQWRVDYREGGLSRLCIQIGDKGRAVVIPTRPTQPNPV